MGQLMKDYLSRTGQAGVTPSPKPSMITSGGNEYTGSFLTKLKTFLPAVGWEINKTLTNAVSRGAEYFNSVNPVGAKDITVPKRVKESDKIYIGNKFVDETVVPLAGELVLWGAAEALTGGLATPLLAATRISKLPKLAETVQAVSSFSSKYKKTSQILKAAAKQGVAGAEIGALTSFSQGESAENIAKNAFKTGAWATAGTLALGGITSRFARARAGVAGKTTGTQAAGILARESDSLVFKGDTVTAFGNATDDATRYAVAEANRLKTLADDVVKTAPERAAEIVDNIEVGKLSESEMHVAGSLIDDLVSKGSKEEAAKVARKLFTKAGESPIAQERVIQIFAKLDRESMEEAAKMIFKENGGKLQDLTRKTLDEVGERLTDIQAMPYGYNRALATAQMLNVIVEAVPKKITEEIGKKVGAFRRLAMLSGTTTTVNNIAGTAVNQLMEGAAKIPSVAIDKLLSVVTGKRSVAFAQYGTGQMGLVEGFSKGMKEVWSGVRFGADGYMDVTSGTFKSTVGKFLERMVQTGLHVPDRSFYISKYAKVADELMRLQKTKFITPAIHQQAHFEALRSTLNNTTVVSKCLESARKFMNNKVPGSGDVLLPFIKVPVNLARTALVDFTPLGLFKTVGEAINPIVGKTFNQREFVTSLGKAMTGTAGIGLTYFLGKMGIMTGGHGKYDSTLTPIENQQGFGANKFNISALQRFFMTGFSDPSVIETEQGDKIISYDWLQPLGMTLGIGATAGEKTRKAMSGGEALGLLGAIKSAATGALGSFNEDTVFGQMINNISAIWEAPTEEGKATALNKLQKIITGIPASFIPNIVNQLRKIEDNNRRKTFDKNWATNAINLMKNKIPGLSKSLDVQYTSFGEVMTYFPEDTNKVLNVLLNPAALNTYTLTPEMEFLMQVYETLPPITYRTEAEKKQDELIAAIYKAAGKKAPSAPDQPRYNIIPQKWGTVRNPDGGEAKAIELTDDQKIELQKDTTMRVVANINVLLSDNGYKSASAEEKLNMIKGQIKAAGSDAEKAMQVRIYGHAYEPYTKKKTTKYKSPRNYVTTKKVKFTS